MWLFLVLSNIGLAYYADSLYEKNKYSAYMSLFLIVLVNTFFIGLRDFGVGTDTLVYIDVYFDYARKIQNINDVFASDILFDKGYLVLALISSWMSDDSQALLVVTEFFITLFIVLGVIQYKKTINFNFSTFFMLFWLIYQVQTINLMRQFCAVSLLFFAFSLFIQRKYVLYIFFYVILFFFYFLYIIFF